MKRVASLQLSIAKILARAVGRHWRFKKCGYKKITVFCRSTFQYTFEGKS